MPDFDIEKLQTEFAELSQKLADPKYLQDQKTYQSLSKRYGELKGLLAGSLRVKSAEPHPGLDSKSDVAIIEIRPGAGGEEAALFAENLYRMYVRFAEKKGFQLKLLDSRKTDLGGLKEIIFQISGKDAFQKLQRESGVHRVQRIPETEKSGRIHTSTASIAVLPKARPLDIEVRAEDIKIDTFRASGPGGQNVNKTSSAVRVTHIPTGIVAESQQGRLQQDNKELALTILRARLLKKKTDEEAQKRGELRKQQIGTAERSEKIRTYNFPQDRVTDHRIQKSWGNIKRIMDGDIDQIIDETHSNPAP